MYVVKVVIPVMSFTTTPVTVGATESTVTVELASALAGPAFVAKSTNPFALSDTPAFTPLVHDVNVTVVTSPTVFTVPIVQPEPTAVKLAEVNA